MARTFKTGWARALAVAAALLAAGAAAEEPGALFRPQASPGGSPPSAPADPVERKSLGHIAATVFPLNSPAPAGPSPLAPTAAPGSPRPAPLPAQGRPAPRPNLSVVRRVDLSATLTVQEVQTIPIYERILIEFSEQSAGGGTATPEAVRKITKAEWESARPGGERPVKSLFALPGQQVRVVWTANGVTVLDVPTGQRVWNKPMITAMGPPLTIELWPSVPPAPGSTWTFTGPELTRLIHHLPIQGGLLKLTLDKLGEDPATKLQLAAISGKFEALVPLSPVPALLSAEVRMDVAVDWNIILRLSINGTLAATSAVATQMGDLVNVALSGKAVIEQRCTIDAANLPAPSLARDTSAD